MKKLDKYLISQFIISFMGSLVLLIGLYLISIFIDNVKYFYHPNVPFGIIFLFIINIIPEIIVYVSPTSALFATSFVFGNLNISNEIIAIYNGGISFIRLILPLLIVGIILSVLSLFFFEFVAADCSSRAFEIRNKIKKLTGKSLNYMYAQSDYFLLGRDKTVYHIDSFSADKGKIIRPLISKFDKKGMLTFQLYAPWGRYDETEKIWNFKNAVVFHFNKKGKMQQERIDYYTLKLPESPASFMKTARNVLQMRLQDAIKFIKEKKRDGGDYRKYLVEFQWRFAFPLSIVIIIFIGSLFGIYFRKAILVLSFFLSLLVSFSYYGILSLGLAFGKTGRINPYLAAWLANIIYLIICIIALKLKKV